MISGGEFDITAVKTGLKNDYCKDAGKQECDNRMERYLDRHCKDIDSANQSACAADLKAIIQASHATAPAGFHDTTKYPDLAQELSNVLGVKYPRVQGGEASAAISDKQAAVIKPKKWRLSLGVLRGSGETSQATPIGTNFVGTSPATDPTGTPDWPDGNPAVPSGDAEKGSSGTAAQFPWRATVDLERDVSILLGLPVALGFSLSYLRSQTLNPNIFGESSDVLLLGANISVLLEPAPSFSLRVRVGAEHGFVLGDEGLPRGRAGFTKDGLWSLKLLELEWIFRALPKSLRVVMGFRYSPPRLLDLNVITIGQQTDERGEAKEGSGSGVKYQGAGLSIDAYLGLKHEFDLL